MNTEIFHIHDVKKQSDDICSAAKIIKNGGLVAFPTETVYGVGANALDESAVKKIYLAKGRPSDNPLIVHLSDPSHVNMYAYTDDGIEENFIKYFWPGPLTLVMKKKCNIPATVTAGLQTVALRCPSHPVAKALIEESGVPIAAPSANISGRPSTTEPSHVIDDLIGRVNAIICAGNSVYGLESTVLDITRKPTVILRPGFITKEDLLACYSEVITSWETDAVEGVPRSPGMKYRHYAPKATIRLVRGEYKVVMEYITEVYEKDPQEKACILFPEEYKVPAGFRVYNLGSINDPAKIASNLFSVLREIDKTDINTIYTPYLEGEGLFTSIMNRIKKAAGDTIINIK